MGPDVIGIIAEHDFFCKDCANYIIGPLKRPVFKGAIFSDPPRCKACDTLVEGTKRPLFLLPSST